MGGGGFLLNDFHVVREEGVQPCFSMAAMILFCDSFIVQKVSDKTLAAAAVNLESIPLASTILVKCPPTGVTLFETTYLKTHSSTEGHHNFIYLIKGVAL